MIRGRPLGKMRSFVLDERVDGWLDLRMSIVVIWHLGVGVPVVDVNTRQLEDSQLPVASDFPMDYLLSTRLCLVFVIVMNAKKTSQLQTQGVGISLNYETGFLLFETLPLILRHKRVSKWYSHDYETGFLNYKTSSKHFETDCNFKICRVRPRTSWVRFKTNKVRCTFHPASLCAMFIPVSSFGKCPTPKWNDEKRRTNMSHNG